WSPQAAPSRSSRSIRDPDAAPDRLDATAPPSPPAPPLSCSSLSCPCGAVPSGSHRQQAREVGPDVADELVGRLHRREVSAAAVLAPEREVSVGIEDATHERLPPRRGAPPRPARA